LVRQILGIVESQIEIERIFSLEGYLQTWEDVIYNFKIWRDWYLWAKTDQMILELIVNQPSIWWS
jgi:hypothetical protein